MSLSRSAKFYRDNPKARKKKAKYDKKLNARPEQKKKRAEANQANRKSKIARKGDGLDASHTKNGIVFKKASVNRGSKSDSKGDRNARGKKRK